MRFGICDCCCVATSDAGHRASPVFSKRPYSLKLIYATAAVCAQAAIAEEVKAVALARAQEEQDAAVAAARAERVEVN